MVGISKTAQSSAGPQRPQSAARANAGIPGATSGARALDPAARLLAKAATLEAELERVTRERDELAARLSNERSAHAILQHRHQAVVESATWRLTRPLRGLLNALRSLRPLVKGFAPLTGVRHEGGDRFVATHIDPQLSLTMRVPMLPVGWHRLRGTLRLEEPKAPARLYLDTGCGYREQDSWPVSPGPAGEVDELLELPFGAISVRLDPFEGNGGFSACAFTLRPMTRLEAAVRLVARDASRQRASGQASFLGALLAGLAAFLSKRTLPRPVPIAPAVPTPAELVADAARIAGTPATGYSFSGQQASGYTYVPPAPPHDLKRALEGLRARPRFSIVVPVYNTPPELLRLAVASVKAQWYPDWELILVDDASPSPQTQAVLAEIKDERIVIERLAKNRGIAGATNAAIELATGDFVVFLDHDDEYTADCLFELARCIAEEDPDFVYSDEDKISEAGEFVEPHFKPSWSPDTMMSTMYTCHVMCVRRTLLREVGGLRSEYDGCQDWDLVLRLTERTGRIAHVPKVLYHWRVIPNSIAAAMTAKPYAIENARRLRADTLARRGRKGTVEPVEELPGFFRVRYALEGNPLVSIIIPTRDNGAVLARCLASIEERSTWKNREVVILDNGSKERGTVAYLDELRGRPGVRVVPRDAPFNYSELNNLGWKAARGQLLLFLNDDTEVVTPDWLERLGGYAQLPHVGAVGAKLCYPGNQRVQHAGILNLEDGPGHAFLNLPASAPGYFGRNLLDYNWLAVTGACLMVERSKYEKVGGFEEALPIAYNDIDLCMKLTKAGYYSVVCQAARLVHHESLSRGKDESPEKLERLRGERARLYARHPEYFQRDPFHNENLHPNGIHFELVA